MYKLLANKTKNKILFGWASLQVCDLEVRSDQFSSKWVKINARETTLSQFVHSEDKATTSITREPDSEQIKGLIRSIFNCESCM